MTITSGLDFSGRALQILVPQLPAVVSAYLSIRHRPLENGPWVIHEFEIEFCAVLPVDSSLAEYLRFSNEDGLA